MILKGSQRGGAMQLARHLLNVEENEHVEVHELRGFASMPMWPVILILVVITNNSMMIIIMTGTLIPLKLRTAVIMIISMTTMMGSSYKPVPRSRFR